MAFYRNKFCSLTYHMCYLALIVCCKGRSFSHVGQGGELFLHPRGGTDTYLSSLGHEIESSATIDAVPRLSMRDARLGWSVMSLCPLLSGALCNLLCVRCS